MRQYCLLLVKIPSLDIETEIGVDTTAIALTYISYELAKNPEYFKKLARELSNYKTIDDLQSLELERLPLLNAVIREVLRLYPPAPSPIFSRVVPADGVTLCGYKLPGGVIHVKCKC